MALQYVPVEPGGVNYIQPDVPSETPPNAVWINSGTDADSSDTTKYYVYISDGSSWIQITS